MSGIYVHIPFCRQKCRYCDFLSFPDKLNLAESYMTCLFHEMAMRGEELKNYSFDTLYIGGGTPSVVDESYIAMLVAAARRYLHLAKNAEITIEMNPESVTAEKIALYKKVGINRFSVGLQSANDALLRDIGRCHNIQKYLECAKLLKGENFNADIMIGLKGQTEEDVVETIRTASKSGASHISMYALTPEDGTPIYSDYLNGELPDGDETAAMYSVGLRELSRLGYTRYEVSNFAKTGRESRHNKNYWLRGEYIGFGVSASSHINNVRFTNTYDLDEYFKCIMSNRFPVIDKEEVDKTGRIDETIMLSFRTVAGLDVVKFEKEFGVNFKSAYAQALKKNAPYLTEENGFIRIKGEYLYVQNTIICDFLS